MRVLAIDPGTTISGYVLFDGTVLDAGVIDNTVLIDRLHTFEDVDMLAIEMIASYGMAVGKEVFETCVMIGRFIERWKILKNLPCDLIYRRDVKLNLCGSVRAKDANIRQSLIDLLGKPGTKKQPGPTFGVTSHAWSALAVAVTCRDKKNKKSVDMQILGD